VVAATRSLAGLGLGSVTRKSRTTRPGEHERKPTPQNGRPSSGSRCVGSLGSTGVRFASRMTGTPTRVQGACRHIGQYGNGFRLGRRRLRHVRRPWRSWRVGPGDGDAQAVPRNQDQQQRRQGDDERPGQEERARIPKRFHASGLIRPIGAWRRRQRQLLVIQHRRHVPIERQDRRHILVKLNLAPQTAQMLVHWPPRQSVRPGRAVLLIHHQNAPGLAVHVGYLRVNLGLQAAGTSRL